MNEPLLLSASLALSLPCLMSRRLSVSWLWGFFFFFSSSPVSSSHLVIKCLMIKHTCLGNDALLEEEETRSSQEMSWSNFTLLGWWSHVCVSWVCVCVCYSSMSRSTTNYIFIICLKPEMCLKLSCSDLIIIAPPTSLVSFTYTTTACVGVL